MKWRPILLCGGIFIVFYSGVLGGVIGTTWIGYQSDKQFLLNTDCKVIEKEGTFDIEFPGSFARIDNSACCVVPGLDKFQPKKNTNYELTNSFTFCNSGRNKGNITIKW